MKILTHHWTRSLTNWYVIDVIFVLLVVITISLFNYSITFDLRRGYIKNQLFYLYKIDVNLRTFKFCSALQDLDPSILALNN